MSVLVAQDAALEGSSAPGSCVGDKPPAAYTDRRPGDNYCFQ